MIIYINYNISAAVRYS